MIFLATPVADAAYFTVRARDAGIKNLLVGTDMLASSRFTRRIHEVA